MWYDSIDLGTLSNVTYYYFDYKDIHMTPEALVLLAKETQKLADLYDLDRPRRMIVPGVAPTPFGTTANEIKTTYGPLGYTSAQTYVNPSLLTYNEFNPSGSKQYGMTWGQFDEDSETETIEQIKTIIADGIAKHKVLLSHGHFTGNYYTNTSQILDWSRTNNIPVLTTTEWTSILYNNNSIDNSINIFPPLNIDLDENGRPDGYNSISHLDGIDGPTGSNGYSLYISEADQTGGAIQICNISGLGGLEKGENYFEIWVKGGVGKIVVDFDIGESLPKRFYIEDINNTDWSLRSFIFTIPNELSLMSINIKCYSYTSGIIKIGGMSLKAHEDPVPVELTSFTATYIDLGVKLEWNTATEVNNYGFEIERAISNDNTFESFFRPWEKIAFVEGHGNSYSPKSYSFLDSTKYLHNNIQYRLKQIDTDGAYEYSHNVLVTRSSGSDNLDNDIDNKLFQNHPNPFNPSTIITYQIKQPVEVSLKVYDIIGNEVATLIDNEQKNAGYYSVEFNKYQSNNSLSSGIYFYQIIAGNYLDTKKMLLLK